MSGSEMEGHLDIQRGISTLLPKIPPQVSQRWLVCQEGDWMEATRVSRGLE